MKIQMSKKDIDKKDLLYFQYMHSSVYRVFLFGKASLYSSPNMCLFYTRKKLKIEKMKAQKMNASCQ